MESKLERRILTVEDSPDLRSLIKMALMPDKYDVIEASNGNEALKTLRSMKELPNLILLDLEMPVMDGYEFRRQQELDPKIGAIPVVIMSGGDDIQIQKLKIGAVGAIKKPFDVSSLLSVVRRSCSPKNDVLT